MLIYGLRSQYQNIILNKAPNDDGYEYKHPQSIKNTTDVCSCRPNKRHLTQLSDVVLGDIAGEGDGAGEQRCVGSSVVQSEALMWAHLGGRLPRCLDKAAIHYLGVEGRRRWHCNTRQTVSRYSTHCQVIRRHESSRAQKSEGGLLVCIVGAGTMKH